MCDLETSRIGAPYIYDISNLRVNSGYPICCEPGQLSRYSDFLRAGRFGDGIPAGGEIFRTCPDRPWDPPSLPYNGYRVFPGGKERPGRDADPSPPSSAVGHERVELYLYSPYGPVRPVQSVIACTRVTFTFTPYVCICCNSVVPECRSCVLAVIDTSFTQL